MNTFAKQLNAAAPCEGDCKKLLTISSARVEDLCSNCQSIAEIIMRRNLLPSGDAKLVTIAKDITYAKFDERVAFMLHVVAYNNIVSDAAKVSFQDNINAQLTT